MRDIFTTAVPQGAFHTSNPSQEFSFYIWTSFLIRTEAFLLGGRPLPVSPEDMTEGAKLANIAICSSIKEPPYLFRWDMPGPLVRGFDYIADRGYPWRMLHGGYHEVVTQKENNVRIWWICAHEYGINDGKILPWLGNWGHRMYAKALLDLAVRNLHHNP
jgi:hypothetical protein